MSAIAEARNTPELNGLGSLPSAIAVKNDEILFAGTMLATDATPEVVNAADTAGLVMIGRCEADVDNSSDGETVSPEMGCFKYENDASNPVVVGDKVCYVKDNQTVCATAGSTHKVVAGLVIAVESDGVWVCQTLEGLRAAQALHDLGDASATAHIADAAATDTAPAAITYVAPSGGATQDAEARASLAQSAADVAALRTRQGTIITELVALKVKINAILAALETQNVLKAS
jgi:hypothetical protein